MNSGIFRGAKPSFPIFFLCKNKNFWPKEAMADLAKGGKYATAYEHHFFPIFPSLQLNFVLQNSSHFFLEELCLLCSHLFCLDEYIPVGVRIVKNELVTGSWGTTGPATGQSAGGFRNWGHMLP